FREGKIQLLFSTSTLAWGVNLPARCVVIRDTKLHDPLEGEVDMSPLDILQMLGRAGRPGYDDAGYAYVVCDGADADGYRRLLRDGKPIESRLADDLAEHLNAEIVLGTISDVEDVLEWLETTFYYVRARRSADGYDSAEALRERVSDTLDRLLEGGFAERSGLAVEPTILGQLASRFYLRLDTAETFDAVARGAADGDGLDSSTILRAVAEAAEFDSVSARRDEREVFGAVLGGEGADLDPGNRKVLAILRASMDGTTPAELQSDAWVIRQNARRHLAALRAFCERLATPRAANTVARVDARVEHGIASDAVGLTAIDGVGTGRANRLAREGFATPEDVRQAGTSGLGNAGLSDGVAERVLASAEALPSVEFEWAELPESIPTGENDRAELTVRNLGDAEPAGIRLTVNGIEMSAQTAYLGETTVPVGVFGGDAEELRFEVEVAFPGLPVSPVTDERTVAVD
ncbi:MAG: helicase-related protein, partial [Natronomonas sp.]